MLKISMKDFKKIKLTFVFILGFAMFGFSQAKLEIDDAKKSFGFVKKGELVKLNYVITNSGKEPLVINEIEISCSCTSAEYDKKPVLPQQTTTVTIIFDTKTVYDRQDRVVLVHSNDKSGPHKLRYKGVVLTK